MPRSPRGAPSHDALSAAAPSGSSWSPDSWRSKALHQNPVYEDQQALREATGALKQRPPLVTYGEVTKLKSLLAEVGMGRRFLLQGGDCAEQFDECSEWVLEKKVRILLMMSLVLSWAAKIPCVRIGRLAGQYAKPRSAPTEMVNVKQADGSTKAVELPSYRGDIINGSEPAERRPCPDRMVRAFSYSATTLNFIRSRLGPHSSFANLRNAASWDLGFVKCSVKRAEYEEILNRLGEAMAFMDACGVFGEGGAGIDRAVDLFSSHEGLLLEYESALVRKDEESGEHFCGSGHFLWVGDRTRQLDGAHVEFFRGVANPIGMKVGPSAKAAEIAEICKVLNPENVLGKIVLISRMGADKVESHLPPIVREVKQLGLKVVWQCDPMHGNTYKTDVVQGVAYKTRSFDAIIKELVLTFDVHRKEGGFLGGVHFEMTGENVTECVGGQSGVSEADLPRAYVTGCDPRLNHNQSLEMAFLVAQKLLGTARR